MSSHHVVRENQEPAVLFIDAANCDLNTLNQALEWSPLVIASATSCQFLLDKGIKVDVIFYKDEQPVGHIHLIQSNIELIQYKDDLLQESLGFLRKRDHNAVYVFSAFEEAASTFLANKNDLTVNIFDGKIRWALVKESISKWFPKDRKLFVLGSNVKFYRNSAELKLEDIKPIKTSGIIKFSTDSPFWLGEVLT